MVLRTESGIWVAHFSHSRQSESYSKIRATTSCWMHEGACQRNEKGQCLISKRWSGQAQCSVSDQFVKATGRKLAFSRAVSTLPIQTRIRLWDSFLNQDSATKYIAQERLREALRKGLARAAHAR